MGRAFFKVALCPNSAILCSACKDGDEAQVEEALASDPGNAHRDICQMHT